MTLNASMSDAGGRVSAQIRRRSRNWDSASTAAIEVSLGNPRCTGVLFEAQLRWAEAYFDRFVIALGDTLRVYNYLTFGHPELGRMTQASARARCIQEGDDWIKSNAPALARLLGKGAYRIVRWDDWKAMPEFESALNDLRALFTSSDEFRAAVLTEVRGYGRRTGHSEAIIESSLELLAEYILEDLAATQVEASLGAVSIYPGSMAVPLRRSSEIGGMPPALVHRRFVYLDLRGSGVA